MDLKLDQKIENGILVCVYPKDLVLNLQAAKKLIQDRLNFQQGKDYPVLIYTNGLKFGSYEGRKYLQREGIIGLKAGAFIVSNAVESMVLNFFLYANRPAIPAKIFPKSKEVEALKWLVQFK